MIRIEFTEEAITKLCFERFHPPHSRVQRKMETLLLKSDGLRPRKVGIIPAKADVEEQDRFKKRIGAPLGGVARRSADRVLRRRGPFCAGAVPGILMDAGSPVAFYRF